MTDPTRDPARYDGVWRAAEPYLRARKNYIHVRLSYHWCLQLLEHYPQADRDVCALAIVHVDIGWHAIDMDRTLEEGFCSENMLQSDVRYLHESEGVRMAKPILVQTGSCGLQTSCGDCDGLDVDDTDRLLAPAEDRRSEPAGDRRRGGYGGAGTGTHLRPPGGAFDLSGSWYEH